jgi:YfiH family protein
MLRKEKDGIPFFEFELFQEFRGGLRHAVFTRHMNINDKEKIQKILDAPAFAPQLSFKNQLHGNDICIIEDEIKHNGDILMTSNPETPLIIRIADCASIMIFDPVKKAIANIHAGWRGFAKRAIHKTIEEFCARYGSQKENLLAGISPMIGPCCYCFSDPYNELPSHLHRFIAKENIVNLWAAAEEHLRECGILPSHIENPRICTACHPEDFYSYRLRREGDSGRFGTAIMLK